MVSTSVRNAGGPWFDSLSQHDRILYTNSVRLYNIIFVISAKRNCIKSMYDLIMLQTDISRQYTYNTHEAISEINKTYFIMVDTVLVMRPIINKLDSHLFCYQTRAGMKT